MTPEQLAEQNEVLRDLFETHAWGIVLSRTEGVVRRLRARALMKTPDPERLAALDAIGAIRDLFEEIYRSADETIPADFRKVFE
jgi:hypothetical protein